MAIPTVVPNLAVIDPGDAVTNWVGDTFSVDNEIFVQNGAAISCAMTNSGANDVWVTGTWDLTAGVHLRMWINLLIVANLNTEALDGMQVWISDGVNQAFWTVAGQDTYPGGWQNFVVFTGSTPTSGTVPTGNTTQIGFRANCATKPRNQPANAYFDYWTYGDGITVTGGTSIDPITLQGISEVDSAGAYGVVNGIEGSYFLTGEVQIGNGATPTYLQDDGSVITYTDRNVSSVLYDFRFNGSGCDAVLNNTVMKSSNPAIPYKFTPNEVNFNSLVMSGCFISNASAITFKGGQTITNSSFNRCNEVNPATATFSSCAVANSIDTISSFYLPPTNSVSSPSFLTYATPTAAIRIDTAGGYPFAGYTFDGSGVAIRNESVGTIDINATGSAGLATDSFINTNGGTTNINNLVTFRVTNVTEDSEVRLISTDATPVELAGVENVAAVPTGLNGVTVDADPDNAGRFRVNYSYSYGGSDTPILAVVHHVDFQYVRTQTLLRATESSLQISQVGDRQYDRGSVFIPSA